MSCDWTEKISALIDGELAEAEARAVESHLGACAACRQAREGFLLLRRQINSYGAAPDPATQRRVLKAVLASKSGATAGNDSRARFGRAGERREPSGVRALAAGLLGGGRFNPALAAALALVLIAVAAGLLAYVSSRRSAPPADVLTQDGATPKDGGVSRDVFKRDEPQPGAQPTPEEEKRAGIAPGAEQDRRGRRQTVAANKTLRRNNRRAGAQRPPTEDATVQGAVAARTGPEGNDPRGLQPAAASVAPAPPPAATVTERPPARAGALDTARHAEQAQMLLRSFRNARLSDGDLAYERARSKKLLYQNIVLRREAASKRDPRTEQALDRLEPILIDIANLPDKPAEDDVNSIRERMRKKNIVVLLQASAATRKRSY